ncbi:autism susceptibility gene 2 protein homolog isoform X3 [Lingula anatina]|uniref:Autism susceptibility gene 2 protein homolog isoform X3 n=1 Tax=Lingula anatina TaxID=7574 RepID=A0A1S3K2H8_LINAN|nr:autism susceptibility gene 2 protein homolog isoform X3 [Lingula anatina]|eukprot:XP_013416599.1 autism susceptibility gene 2 protein homolog isoform X3 [Lingula anatina]
MCNPSIKRQYSIIDTVSHIIKVNWQNHFALTAFDIRIQKNCLSAQTSSMNQGLTKCKEEESCNQVLETGTVNGPQRSTSRDHLSDVSSIQSSSGKGYICDSESGDERASDVGSDLFNNTRHTRDNNVSGSSSKSSTPVTVSSQANTPAPKEPPLTVLNPARPPEERERESEKENKGINHTHLPNSHCSSSSSSSISSCNSSSNSSIPSHSRGNSWGSPSANSFHSVSRHLTPTPNLSLPSRHTPTFRHTPPSLHPHHQSPHSVTPMFAPPIPPPPPLTSTSLGLPSNLPSTPFGADSISSFHSSQELLQRELNNRFLQSTQDRLGALGPPPYLRADIHQHQHQHMHQHQHTHQHNYGPFAHHYSNSLIPAPTPHVKSGFLRPPHVGAGEDPQKFDKFLPKFGDSPFYRHNLPGLPPGYPGVSPVLHPAAPGGLPGTAGIHGAFQPRNLPSNVNHAQLLMSLRERGERNAVEQTPQIPAQKKPGKWCAVHVRIAWEIYHHQQKQATEAQKNPDAKLAPEPLRPPTIPGSSLHRPPDLQASAALLAGPAKPASHSRSPFESSPHSANFLSASHLGVSPFARPSPYAGLGLTGLPNGMMREHPSLPNLTSPHEWSRLHRTPPSFPTPPSWPKSELEKEKERELLLAKEKDERQSLLDRERHYERDKEREREFERERDRLAGRHSPDRRRSSVDFDRSRDRERTERFEDRRRSRSRSPLRNGRDDLRRDYMTKSDSAFNNLHEKTDLKIKEERREDDVMILGNSDKRSDLMHPPGMPPHSFSGPSLLDPRRLMGTPYSLHGERPPPPHGLWNPLNFAERLPDRSVIDFNRHTLEIREELARERERELMKRFQNPLGSLMEHERLREQARQEMMMREHAAREMEAARVRDMQMLYEREFSERSKIPPLRPDSYFTPSASGSIHFTRPASPLVNHSSTTKTNSPSSSVGAPPPLIPSGTASHNSRSHTNSPATKPKTSSPLAVPGKERRESRETNGNSTEVDAQSR